MGQDADAIREDIAATRERMTERADAIAYKADVPARTKDKVRDAKDGLVAKITGQKDELMSTMQEHTPDRGQVGDQAARAKGMAESNPLGLAIGAVALGFLAGLAVPATKVEQERIGPLADELKDKAKTLGQEAMEHGRAVATDVAAAAKDAAQESAPEHAAALKDTAQSELGNDAGSDTGIEEGAGSNGDGDGTGSWSDSSTAGPTTGTAADRPGTSW